jgi:hypothetical protein
MNGVDKPAEAGHSGGKNCQLVVWFEVEARTWADCVRALIGSLDQPVP